MQNYPEQKTNNRLFWSSQGLRNQIRQQIFQLLASKNSCSFNELMRNLNITQPKLAYHLQVLVKYNIIINFYDKREGKKDHSFYELSSFGRELLAGISAPDQLEAIEDPEAEPESQGINHSNFRTIRHVKYKSYDNNIVKHQEHSIKALKNKDRKYFDSDLNCVIINKSEGSTYPKKVNLPSFRKHYLLYKHPFKLKQSVESKL